ncbi:hypothetical protein SDC9_93111 [bioreactor metagenome]|uniref:Phosphoribosyltransferase domain-containing protein n=1 Tax=bioreactor metagenome TaxID=1076179 RepID=A0A645A2D8_9ZZZZ
MINKLYLEKDFKSYLKASKLYLNKTRDIPTSTINKNNIDTSCLNLIEKLELLNQSIVSHNMNSNKKEINLNVIKNICTKLPKNDVLIFIPTGCYQYITSFINKQTYDKIMLWEIHNNKDASHSCKYLTKNIKGKKCLIIDKSYTGKTLDMMEKNIIKNNGYPIKLALFPKSMEAIKRSDYIVFLDKIYKSQSIKEEGDWMNKLYKKTLSVS